MKNKEFKYRLLFVGGILLLGGINMFKSSTEFTVFSFLAGGFVVGGILLIIKGIIDVTKNKNNS